MSRISAWFERKFDFNFPVEQYPNVLVRLGGTPARIEELLHGLPATKLIAKQDGRWSAQEHAGHLLDIEPLWSSRLDDFLKGSRELTAADLNNRKTHEANHNSRDLAEILSAFRRARLHMVDRVAKLDPAVFSNSLVHPRLHQSMRLVDHLYFIAEHDDHHLATIWEMLQ